jgi:predicted signal transduction protein with EAL and GGDEF domain
VNASGRHVGSPTIVADIQTALTASGLAPSQIELELTETTILDAQVADTPPRRRPSRRRQCRDRRLRHRPHIHRTAPPPTRRHLEIDRSFIASDDPRQQALIAVIVEAAHAFDLRVVAEGVETADTLHALRELGCDAAQGYLMARPMPAGDMVSWLTDWRGGTLARQLATAPLPHTSARRWPSPQRRPHHRAAAARIP